MSGSQDELSEVRQALLGFTKEITKTLESAKSNLDEELKNLAGLQKQLVKISMLGVTDQVDVKLKEKLANALDQTIAAANQANKKLKEVKFDRLPKAVNDDETHIKKPGRR
jgi:DNA-binding protein YbaB